MTGLLVATRNPGKLAELRRMLDAAEVAGIQVLGLADVPEFPEEPETGATFAENALAKARDAAKATGLAVGRRRLRARRRRAQRHARGAVRALVRAATATTGRTSSWCWASSATFPTTAGARRSSAPRRWWCPDGGEVVVHGEWPGYLARAPRGTNGFGYDPIFVPDGEERTSAELAPEEKDALSHRGRAMRALLPHLRELAGG